MDGAGRVNPWRQEAPHRRQPGRHRRMKVIVTGASRGIGLELARIALRHGHELLAVARQATTSPALTQLHAEYGEHLRIADVDLRDPKAAETIGAAIKDWVALDVLLNNAGIL